MKSRQLRHGLALSEPTSQESIKRCKGNNTGKFNWINADSYELRILEAVTLLFSGHEKLLIFLFHPTEARLNSSSEILLENAGCFSSNEIILIQIALDFWDGSGKTQLSDIYSALDRTHYLRVLQAVEKIKWTRSV